MSDAHTNLLSRSLRFSNPVSHLYIAVLTTALTVSAPHLLRAGELPIELGATPPSDAIALADRGIEQALKQLPDIVTQVMQRSGVPGVAVAVVHKGKTVFSQGFGVRELGKDQLVNEQTRFQIASISKSLTATIAALAVTYGKVAWDDPVIKYLPEFKLSDPFVTQHATIGDFFAHRSGLLATAGDELEDLGFTRQQIIGKLSQLPLDAFRTSYNYANFGTTLGAEAVAAAVGEAWEIWADKHFFQPTGMRATSYRYVDYIADDNRAALHAYQDGRFQPLYQRNPDAQAPAGGISTNVVDLAQWLKLLLGTGNLDNRPLISSHALIAAMSPQSISSHVQDLNERSAAYGYGFNINVEAGGRPSMGHSGAFLLGAGTAFKVVPSAQLGIVVLTNGAPVGAAEAILGTFMDTALYGKPLRDWFSAYNTLTSGYFRPDGDLADRAKPQDAAVSLDLSAYTGEFANAYFDAAKINVENGQLVLTFGPKLKSFPLDHWSGNIFALNPTGENAAPGSLIRSISALLRGARQTLPFLCIMRTDLAAGHANSGA